MLIRGNKKQTSQKKYIEHLFSYNAHAKIQPLLATYEKKTKMSVTTFLPGALQLCFTY